MKALSLLFGCLGLGLALAACDSDDDGWPPREYPACGQYTSCGTCTPTLGCGWCFANDGQGFCASDPGTCSAAPSAWTWDPPGCFLTADAGIATDAMSTDGSSGDRASSSSTDAKTDTSTPSEAGSD